VPSNTVSKYRILLGCALFSVALLWLFCRSPGEDSSEEPSGASGGNTATLQEGPEDQVGPRGGEPSPGSRSEVPEDPPAKVARGPVPWFVEGRILGAESVDPSLFTVVVTQGPQMLLRLMPSEGHAFAGMIPLQLRAEGGDVQVQVELGGSALDRIQVSPAAAIRTEREGHPVHLLRCELEVELGVVVQGRILDDEGTPVADGMACAFAPEAEEGKLLTRTRTRPDGTFLLVRVGTGLRRLGFLGDSLRPHTLELLLESALDVGDVRLRPGASLSGWLEGSVPESLGPVEVEVRLSKTREPGFWHGDRWYGWREERLEACILDAEVGADGRFEFSGLAEAPHTLRFGGRVHGGCLPSGLILPLPQVVATPPRTDLRVEGPPCFASFHVRNDLGNPIHNARIEYAPDHGCYADGSGLHVLFLPPGVAFELTVKAKGYETELVQLPPLRRGEARGPELVILRPAQSGSIVFCLEEHMGIALWRVQYALVPQDLEAESVSSRWKELSAIDGVFHVSLVPPGRYLLHLRLTGREALDSCAWFEPVPVSVEVGATVSKELRFHTGGKLAIEIVTSDRSARTVCEILPAGSPEPFPGIEFLGWSETTRIFSRSECCPLEVAEGGTASVVPALPPGEYVVRLSRKEGVVAEERVVLGAGQTRTLRLELP